MVHGQHTVELGVEGLGEEVLGRVGAEEAEMALAGLSDGRFQNVGLFGRRLGIEPQQGDAGGGEAEVAQQALMEEGGLLQERLLAELLQGLAQRAFVGDGHAQVVAHMDGEAGARGSGVQFGML